MISELDRLRRHHAEPEPAAVERVRHRVLDGLSRPPRRSGRQLLWGIGVPAGLTAAALAGVTVLPGSAVWPQPGPPTVGAAPTRPTVPPEADAAHVMRLAAQTVRAEPPLRIGPNQYIYRKGRQVAIASMTVSTDGRTLKLFVEQEHQSWLDPRDGLRVLRIVVTSDLNRRPATPADAALAKEVRFDLAAPPSQFDSDHPPKGKGPAGKGPVDQPDRTAPPSLRHPTAAYLAKLPTDPARLLAVIRAEARAEGNTKWSVDKISFGAVTDLFTWGDPLLAPELRAALLDALALMPAVRRVAGQVDLAGRPGIAVGLAERNERSELILDPATLHPVGARTVLLKPADGLPAGPVEQSTFDFAVVDKVGQTR